MASLNIIKCAVCGGGPAVNHVSGVCHHDRHCSGWHDVGSRVNFAEVDIAVGRDMTGIVISLSGHDTITLSVSHPDQDGKRHGEIRSTLRVTAQHPSDARFNEAIDVVESIVLAHACAGVDVTDPRYVEGLQTCVDACANNI